MGEDHGRTVEKIELPEGLSEEVFFRAVQMIDEWQWGDDSGSLPGIVISLFKLFQGGSNLGVDKPTAD